MLADEAMVSSVHDVLARRHPQSRRRGRPSFPAEVVLRLLVLKHIRNWSYAVLERKVRPNMVYREFSARQGSAKSGQYKARVRRLLNATGRVAKAITTGVKHGIAGTYNLLDPREHLVKQLAFQHVPCSSSFRGRPPLPTASIRDYRAPDLISSTLRKNAP